MLRVCTPIQILPIWARMALCWGQHIYAMCCCCLYVMHSGAYIFLYLCVVKLTPCADTNGFWIWICCGLVMSVMSCVHYSPVQCFLDSAFFNLTWLWLWLQVKVRGLTLTLTCAESGQVRSESESGQFNRLNWLLNWLLFFSLKINNLIKFFKFLCVLNCKYINIE